VFEKAQRKVDETAFVVSRLRDEQRPDPVEFLFNATLNAGKNVVNALHAQILFREGEREKAQKAYHLHLKALRFLNPILDFVNAQRARLEFARVRKKAQKAYGLHFKDWRKKLRSDDADLFDVLQELRNIEVHGKESGSKYVPKMEERRYPRQLPSDPRYAAVFANYMTMGMLEAEVTVGEMTYEFQVNAATPSRAGKRVLFERFERSGPKPVFEVGNIYANLLKSLVDHFVATYR